MNEFQQLGSLFIPVLMIGIIGFMVIIFILFRFRSSQARKVAQTIQAKVSFNFTSGYNLVGTHKGYSYCFKVTPGITKYSLPWLRLHISSYSPYELLVRKKIPLDIIKRKIDHKYLALTRDLTFDERFTMWSRQPELATLFFSNRTRLDLVVLIFNMGFQSLRLGKNKTVLSMQITSFHFPFTGMQVSDVLDKVIYLVS
ncbi:hypothetical protein ACFL27_24600 [candidate division CSSED10-310 bacterium]|uniref:Uncharacterized protein n=1 Tax=candidate division CSSED10-310 bacterium TaxID=2855610 RepID=A0ABV6Z4L4_UNCC1